MAASSSSVCTIVLDGANVATRKDGQRAIARLAAALAFFRELQTSRQCALRCVAFVPNFWLNSKPTDAGRGNGAMETDDWALLQSLVDKEQVVLTPSHAHDDFYVIDYAVKNDGFIVTNDMFRDHVENKRVFQGRRLTQRWTRSRCIDFTFVGNEFLPNSQTIERALSHHPHPESPRDTLPAAATTNDDKTVEKAAASTNVRSPRPTLPRRRSSSLTKALARARAEDCDDQGDEDDDTNDMAIEHVRKKKVDLSELTAYRVPRYLLPLLHGDDGETMKRFMDHTGTHIVAPPVKTNATSDVATLSIYGSEAERMHAVKILDAALPELHQQYVFQQQQEQWLLTEHQHQLQQQQQQYHHPHDLQHQQLLEQQQLQQQYLYHQHLQHQQQQQQYHNHHPPANFPLQTHHVYHPSDDHMDIELE